MMRAAALAALLLASAAGAQVRPMPSVDDGSTAKEFPYSETTTTMDIRPRAEASAAAEADRLCAGDRPTAKKIAQCRRERLAAARKAEANRAAQQDYGNRAAEAHARSAACEAGDPDACAYPRNGIPPR